MTAVGSSCQGPVTSAQSPATCASESDRARARVRLVGFVRSEIYTNGDAPGRWQSSGPVRDPFPVGSGWDGEVYQARDTRLDRDFAIKVLPEQLARSPEALARFEREGKAVARLSHPNILALFDVGSEHGVSFAVTELLEGETLRSRFEAA